MVVMEDFVSGWAGSAGIEDGKWYTLELLTQRVGLLGDSNIHVDPTTRLFMFNSSAQMMYIKNLSGRLYKYDSANPDPRIGSNGWLTFDLADGTKVFCQEGEDGITVSGLGKIHTFISYDNIAGFYNERMSSGQAIMLAQENDAI